MSDGFEKAPFLLTKADDFITWAQKNSLWPFGSGLACCAIEMIATAAARYDIARFGMELFRASPRQADLFIVAGTVTNKMAPVLRRLWDQMPDPKWAMAMGNCAIAEGRSRPIRSSRGSTRSSPSTSTSPDVRRHRRASSTA